MAAVVRRVQWCDVENVVCLAPHKKACGYFYMIVNRICLKLIIDVCLFNLSFDPFSPA